MSNNIFLDSPNVGSLEKEYLNKVIDSSFVSSFGPFVPEFESKIADYLNVKKAVATQSGTSAIYMALYELGIGEGDEVIVPVSTFVASVNPIVYLGAKPVFVDVDSRTWNISLSDIENKITKNTKAIIPVHLYGNPCEMEQLVAIARKYNLFIIEDAAESLGAKFKGEHTGSFGDFGCFSFNGNKIITTGGGGMIIGKDAGKLNHINFLINQAKDNSKGLYYSEIGFNYRMTNIEAGLGLAQLDRLQDFLNKKKKFNAIYREELKNIECISFQEEYDGAESSFWLTGIIIDNDDEIINIQEKLKDNGIPSRRVWTPLTEFPQYKDEAKREYFNAYEIYRKGICLPSSTLNSEEGIIEVCNVIKKII